MTRPLAKTARETAARAVMLRINPSRGKAIVPAYVTDGIEVPRRKRRVLLDLAPATVERLQESVIRDDGYRRGIGESVPDDLRLLLTRALELLR